MVDCEEEEFGQLTFGCLFTIFVCNLVHAYKFHDSMFIVPLDIKKN